MANIDPVMGSEQGKTRPVVIVSEDALNEVLPVVNVLPLTSRKPGRRVYPNEASVPAGRFGLTSDSIVLAYQTKSGRSTKSAFSNNSGRYMTESRGKRLTRPSNFSWVLNKH